MSQAQPAAAPWFLVIPGVILLGAAVVALFMGKDITFVIAFGMLGLIALLFAYLGPRLQGKQTIKLGNASVEFNVGRLAQAGAKADKDLMEGKVTELETLEAEDKNG